MTSRKRKIFAGFIICIIVIIGIIFIFTNKKTPAVTRRLINPYYGIIKTFVSTTGTILPQNRLEIKPSISGRVESILVKEGDYVKAGQTLIWMSSTDRAALIDAARAQGGAQLKYWEEVYKPIPLIAPITGSVIVRAMEPGQTATTSTVILVLSDRLIVKANVDETDIGRVKTGQTAEITLDAYPDVIVNGRVTLIKYESTTVNNVTTYEVDILPDKVPAVYKSGMSANINIFDNFKKNVLLLPDEALVRENEKTYVLVDTGKDQKQEKRLIKTGLNDEQSVEVVSGLTDKDKVVIIQKKFVTTDTNKKGSPFMPSSSRRKGQ
jgi:macrolide-specific efflux system membrane fusion protein